MSIHTLNSAKDRKINKTVFMLQLGSAALTAPASHTVLDVNAFILNANGDSTKITMLAGASMNGSPAVSPVTTEGNSVVQAFDVSDGGTWKMLEQTPEEYKALKTAYRGKRCKIVGITGDPDTLVNATTQVVTAVEGNIVKYSHDYIINFMDSGIDGAEDEYTVTFSKQVAGDADTWKDKFTVIT